MRPVPRHGKLDVMLQPDKGGGPYGLSGASCARVASSCSQGLMLRKKKKSPLLVTAPRFWLERVVSALEICLWDEGSSAPSHSPLPLPFLTLISKLCRHLILIRTF